MRQPHVHLDVRLPLALRERLARAAALDGRSLSEFVRRAAEAAAKRVEARGAP